MHILIFVSLLISYLIQFLKAFIVLHPTYLTGGVLFFLFIVYTTTDVLFSTSLPDSTPALPPFPLAIISLLSVSVGYTYTLFG